MREKPVKNSIRCRSSSARRRPTDDRGHREGAVGAELDHVRAAVGRPDLVLVADVLADHLLLDPDRLPRQVLGGRHPPGLGAQAR